MKKVLLALLFLSTGLIQSNLIPTGTDLKKPVVTQTNKISGPVDPHPNDWDDDSWDNWEDEPEWEEPDFTPPKIPVIPSQEPIEPTVKGPKDPNSREGHDIILGPEVITLGTAGNDPLWININAEVGGLVNTPPPPTGKGGVNTPSLALANSVENKKIYDKLNDINRKLDQIDFWASFRVFKVFRAIYTNSRMNELVAEMKKVHALILELPDHIDGSPNVIKRDMLELSRVLHKSIEQEQLLFKTLRTEEIGLNSKHLASYIKKNVEACDAVVSSITKAKQKLDDIIFWCRVRKLNIPYLTEWCIHDDGSAMIMKHFEHINIKINRIPESPQSDRFKIPDTNTYTTPSELIKKQLREKMEEAKTEMTRELIKWKNV